MVDPNLLVKALVRTGYHAEVKWASIKHPRFSKNYYDNNYNYHNYPPIGYNYGSNHNPYPYQYHQQQQQHALPDPMTHHHYSMSTPYSHHGWDPYYYGSDTYYYRPGPPHARYVPSYPPREYDPYDDDEPISLCSIM
ncbi:Unknown protein [Striga hermonthica]|uniref:Uncharacterized protein n=1 Tax=Striga hermonthica TaxID=68872 RepID=A0A9N7NB41_STRHE|nr:Unknown protein [Striga hermonthica]